MTSLDFVKFLKHKSDILAEVFKLFLKQESDLYKIQCDNAKGMSGELARVLLRKVVSDRSSAPPYSPPLNGVAGRANRYLLEKARALMKQSF
ncbi:hypothetical protein AVEN_116047-1 [Araneus ventricosus]|uniref:Integrase catalytic domain-containing protein n=1 Tax=Araneus ventricosus TaxID=182803 RepID=A0A4Y2KUZ6_ARAVE|nr:hypothetical protein AVEN_116047-1 [Araneus ventricosus]